MLNLNKTSESNVKKRYLNCNGNSYDVTNINGSNLVEKLQEIALNNRISRFDIYDSEKKNLSPADIESGNFSGDLLLKIENLL